MDLNYSQLHAQITRLAKLATWLEPKEKRETLVRIKENSAFLNAISSADRQIITAENVRREQEHLSQMNIDQMATLLTQRSADRMSAQEVIFKATENSRPNVGGKDSEVASEVAPGAGGDFQTMDYTNASRLCKLVWVNNHACFVGTRVTGSGMKNVNTMDKD